MFTKLILSTEYKSCFGNLENIAVDSSFLNTAYKEYVQKHLAVWNIPFLTMSNSILVNYATFQIKMKSVGPEAGVYIR